MVLKNLPVGIKIVSPVKYSYLVGMSRWESLYTIFIWVNTNLNHIDTRAIWPRYGSSCMVYRPKWHQKQYRQTPIPYWYQKRWNPFKRYPNGMEKRQYQTSTGSTQSHHEMWHFFAFKKKSKIQMDMDGPTTHLRASRWARRSCKQLLEISGTFHSGPIKHCQETSFCPEQILRENINLLIKHVLYFNMQK